MTLLSTSMILSILRFLLCNRNSENPSNSMKAEKSRKAAACWEVEELGFWRPVGALKIPREADILCWVIRLLHRCLVLSIEVPFLAALILGSCLGYFTRENDMQKYNRGF
jgi:hypothetical protein